MPGTSAPPDLDLRRSFLSLVDLQYFDAPITARGKYPTFLKDVKEQPPKDPFRAAEDLFQKGAACLATNRPLAHRLWLESVVATLGGLNSGKRSTHSINSINSINKALGVAERAALEGDTPPRAKALFAVVALSLKVHLCIVQNSPIKDISPLIDSSFTSQQPIIPIAHLAGYIQYRLNGIYYNKQVAGAAL
ncbi:hypothetical protein NEDG_00464 [Nematocida displodere]|uniref:Uncharacterized protein n=1 Tax=Nematocida displodere TaxID=1805483 RepID=A0A177ELX9_9MICR|nr:hypothetical protein NEDG_00464 [Nematocida displodere]